MPPRRGLFKDNHGMQAPPIPVIEDNELLDAVSALTRAACVMRSLLLSAVEGEPALDLLKKHNDVAMLADSIIEKWREHLGIDVEDALNRGA